MKDLFTIALPVYKRTQYIKSALDSAVNQSVKCRILLIDNNSPHDEFKKIIDSYNNPLIKYVKTDSTVPQDENFNNCFRYADTPWVTILHDDDYLHYQFVELAQYILKKFGQNIGGFATKSHVSENEWQEYNMKIDITNDIRKVKEGFFYFSQLTPFPGVVLNKDKALSIGGFRADNHPIADFDFWYRYSKEFGMLYVNQNFSYYRISPVQSTNTLIDAMVNNVYDYRLNLIKKSKYNNLITKMVLETSRINNLNFFKKTYPNVQLPQNIRNKKFLEFTRNVTRNRIIYKLLLRYQNQLSFANVKV